jgi:hypothetical protein
MRSYGAVGMYLQEFLTPLSEIRQLASGPGHFTRRETSVSHGTGTDLLKQMQCRGTEKSHFCAPTGI